VCNVVDSQICCLASKSNTTNPISNMPICLQIQYEKSELCLRAKNLRDEFNCVRRAAQSTIISLWCQKLHQINASKRVSTRLCEIHKADTWCNDLEVNFHLPLCASMEIPKWKHSKTHRLAGTPVPMRPSWRHTVNFLSLPPLIWERKHGPNFFPRTITTKQGAVWGKLCSWVDTMVGITLVSRSKVSQGKNNLAQWCLTYFLVPNKTRISKQAEGTLASLSGELEECWEWTAVELGETNQECVYMMVQLWTSMKHQCQKFPRLMPKVLWKRSGTLKSAGDLVE